MQKKISCPCDNSFTVEIPEEINLDSNPSYLDEILNGTFFSFSCPGCTKKHKPEFPLKVLWPSKKVWFNVFPELDRGEFYRQKKEASDNQKETIIGYPELADRLLIYRDGLEPAAVEAIKYYLLLKAEEQYPEDEMEIWYSGYDPGSPAGRAKVISTEGPQVYPLVFHIHGIKQDEVAVMKIPFDLYKKTLQDYKSHPKNEIFTALRVRSYLSVKNTMRPEELK